MNYLKINVSRITKKLLVLVMFVSLVSLSGGLGTYLVQAATTNMDVVMTAGSLTTAASAAATLTGKTVSASAQTTTGSIDNVSLTDLRGTGAGWSVVMTSQNFTTKGTTKDLAGSNSTVDFTGTYDGLDGVLDPVGTFEVEITTTGGDVGTATFTWTDPAGTTEGTDVLTASTVVLSNGISVTFAVATYVVGDKWSAKVDTFPYTGLTVTPGSITAASGSLTGVTAGSAEALAGSGVASDSKTLMTATVNNGAGDYDQAESLSLDIHANSLDGTFVADAVITAS